LWREAYLKDPDGNIICLFSAGQNRKTRRGGWRTEAERQQSKLCAASGSSVKMRII